MEVFVTSPSTPGSPTSFSKIEGGITAFCIKEEEFLTMRGPKEEETPAEDRLMELENSPSVMLPQIKRKALKKRTSIFSDFEEDEDEAEGEDEFIGSHDLEMPSLSELVVPCFELTP